MTITLKDGQDVILEYPRKFNSHQDPVCERWLDDGRGGSIGNHPQVHITVGDNPDLLKGIFKTNLGVDLTPEESDLMSKLLKIANYKGLKLIYYTKGYWSAQIEIELKDESNLLRHKGNIYASLHPGRATTIIKTLEGLCKDIKLKIKSRLAESKKRWERKEAIYLSNLDAIKQSLAPEKGTK